MVMLTILVLLRNNVRLDMATETNVLANERGHCTNERLEEDCSPVKKRWFCFHCAEGVGYSTYYRHRYKYFDLKTQTWVRAIGTADESTESSEAEEEDALVNESKCLGID